MSEKETYVTDSETVADDQPVLSPQHHKGQFVFESLEAPKPRSKNPSLRTRLSSKATRLSLASTIVAASVLSAVVGAGVGVTAFSLISRPSPIVVNDASSVNWVTGAAVTASPSVVTISVSSSQGAGSGSGVVLTADGYILTNTHVVTLDGATASPTIEVKTNDGHIYSAIVVGTDPTNDLAVIKVAVAAKLSPVTFANSERINVGDAVVAIGAPLGLDATVTSGIVSALNRTIQVASAAAPENGAQGGGGLQLWTGNGKAPINLSVIQTDAAINPGNSGGALINEQGQLIGINVAIASSGSSSGGQAGNIGVGFAIPSNVAKRIADEIMSTGHASHAMLGALVHDAKNSETAASFSTGAQVEALTAGGAAEKAGVLVGDVITEFNSKQITSSQGLMSAVRQQAAGATATLKLLRDGKLISLSVTLGDAVNLKQ